MEAVQAEGAEIKTIEAYADASGKLHPIQQAFWEEHGLQCGFCTPGMVIAIDQLLRDNPNPSEADVRRGLDGNLCRCTGYQNIVKSALSAGRKLRGEEPFEKPEAALTEPRLIVDIGRIPGLAYVRREDGVIAIGAMTTYREIERSAEVHQAAPVLAEAVHEVGDPQVRAKGTLAGALAHADPAGDLPAVALALGGTGRAVGKGGERDIDLDAFFVDMLTTQLQEREIIREVRLRAQPAGTGAAYQKFDQPASHYALTGVCALISLQNGQIASARLGVTGVGP